MTMNRRLFSAALLSAGAAGATLTPLQSALAQAAAVGPAEGRDYTKLEPPQPPGPTGRLLLEPLNDRLAAAGTDSPPG